MLFIFLLNLSLVLCNFTDSSDKLIIDNDAGGDDAMAIFIALLYEKHYNGPKLIALTTGNGNTNEDNVCTNNQRILKVAKRQDVPIYRGSKTSLVITPNAGNYYGKDGLGDSEEVVTGLVPPQSQDAVSALIELSKTHKDRLTVVTIGTLTNVALAIKLDPDFINRLKHLYVGAGHIHDDSLPHPEFNAHMDVEAYHIVAQYANPDKVTFLPFSQVKRYLDISRAWRTDVLGRIPTEIMRAQNVFERVSLAKEEHWHDLDPAVVAAVVRPDLVGEYKYAKNDIILCGDKRGINTNEFVDKEHANVRVVYSFKLEDYKKFLLELFAFE